MKNYVIPVIASVLLCACSADPETSGNGGQLGELLFNSGFENDVVITANPSGNDYISGIDRSVSAPNDWSIFTMGDQRSPYLGAFYIQYEGGTPTIRKARIVADPVNPGNKVLHFWVTDPNALDFSKTRIQANIYGSNNGSKPGLMKMYQRVRMYLPEGMATLNRYPLAITWLTIAEFWNNNSWSAAPYPFRLSIGMKKDAGTQPGLHFSLNSEDYSFETGHFTQIYGEQNYNFIIPYGKWMTIEYYYQDGNTEAVGQKPPGYFFMAVTPEGEQRQIIFSRTMATHNTHDPASDGLTMWNPMKLYTSDDLMIWMKSQIPSQPLEIYWDDLSIYKDRVPVME